MQSSDRTIKWSGKMILKSLKFVMTESNYNGITTQFIRELKTLNTVITSAELRQKLQENLPSKIYNVTEIMKNLEKLIMQDSFMEILQLGGTINIMPLKISTSIYHSSRNWLYFFALELFNMRKFNNRTMPKCAKYIAIFEADKLAQQLKNNYLINIERDVVKRVVWEILSSIPHQFSTGHVGIIKNDKSFTKELFDQPLHYYLIPEYYQMMDAENEGQQMRQDQLRELLMSKVIFQKFFEQLAYYHPFNVNPATANIPYTVDLRTFSSQSTICFRRTAYHFLQHKKSPPLSLASIQSSCEYVDPLELISFDEYRELIKSQKSLEYMPMPLPNHTFNINGRMIPLSSATYQLCLPTCPAFIQWIRLFVEDEALDRFQTNKLGYVREYIKKGIEFFAPHKVARSSVDYHEYIALVEEWKVLRKRYLKHQENIPPFPNILTMQYFDQTATFTERLFPMLSTLYKQCVSVVFKMDNILRSSLKMIAMLAEYPMAAVLIHNQKHCEHIFHGNFCALDLMMPDAKPKRCDVKMSDKMVKAIWEKNGVVEGADGGPVWPKLGPIAVEPSSRSASTQTDIEPSGMSVSTQIDMTTILDDTLERDQLEADYLQAQNDILRLTEELNQKDEEWRIERLKLMDEQHKMRDNMCQQIDYHRIKWQKMVTDNQLINLCLEASRKKMTKQSEEHARKAKELKKEAQGWKNHYEKLVSGNNSDQTTDKSLVLFGGNNPVYYKRLIEQGDNLLKAARNELRKFMAKSRPKNEKIRAQRELEDFEITVESTQRRARRNLEILKEYPKSAMEDLLKVTPYPMPFSDFIYSRMDEL